MPLFESGDAPFWETFQMCLWATATGDMLFMLTLYVSVTLVHRSVLWACDRSTYWHPATWVVPVVIGVLLAVSFELWAVHAVDRWIYSSMPIIPVIQVGLTPVLQIIFIPIGVNVCAFWFADPPEGESKTQAKPI